MTFGEALEHLKLGDGIARAGWNGKRMCIYLNKGAFDGAYLMSDRGKTPAPFPPKSIEGVSGELFEAGTKGTVTRLPNINMRTPTGSVVTGWLASQTDMLAEDWEVVS